MLYIKSRNPLTQNKFLRLYLSITDFIYYVISFFIKRDKKKIDIKNCHRILLRNPASLGDLLYTLRLIYLIKYNNADVKVGVLISKKTEFLAKKCSNLDYLHVTSNWSLSESKINIILNPIKYCTKKISAIREVRKIGYDCAIDCYYYYPSASFFFLLCGIKKRIGFGNINGDYLLTNKIMWINKDQHNYEYQKELLLESFNGFIDYEAKLNNLDLHKNYFMEKDVSFEAYGIVMPYIVIAPCASDEMKELPIGFWVNIIRWILDRFHCNILLIGAGKRESDICGSISSQVTSKDIKPLCGIFGIDELFYIVRKSKAFLGVDSFWGHVSALYHIPQISFMHGANNKYQWQPYGNINCIVFRTIMPCSPCYFPNKCAHKHKCLDFNLEDIKKAFAIIWKMKGDLHEKKYIDDNDDTFSIQK